MKLRAMSDIGWLALVFMIGGFIVVGRGSNWWVASGFIFMLWANNMALLGGFRRQEEKEEAA